MGAVNFLALLLGFCVILYSVTYWRTNAENHRFYAFALWAVAATSVALCTRHLLVFLFAWEAVTLMLYLLIGTGEPEARAGAAKTFSILGFGDVALILAVAGVFAIGGARALDIDFLQGDGRIALTSAGHVALYLLFLAAALAKAGAMPLHTWVPAAAEHAPVPTMALLPASLDKLLGIMLLARISLGFFGDLTAGLQILLMVIGVVTIIAAAMMALIQHELKKLLSFHAVSQVGYMVLGIGTGVPVGIAGGLFHMINHAIYKCLLFLSGGAVESRTGDVDLDDLGGGVNANPGRTRQQPGRAGGQQQHAQHRQR
jgi:formate hydrogenlyase subunit 3/multisubunit Na+/H+ antiporter MnhD subunit